MQQKIQISEKPLEKKKKSTLPFLVAILSILLLGGGFYVLKNTSLQSTGLDFQEAKKKVQLKDVDWQTTVIQGPVFASFGAPVEPPLEVGSSQGNPNPFAKKLKK